MTSDTRLAALIKQAIRADGPMPVDRYMALCLTHPQHGYYMRRDPFGPQGDFITAPEISQIFGELIGVWCLSIWEAIGRPRPFDLVELGPGRGTLMRDILRATRNASSFRNALAVQLIEASPELAVVQRHTLTNTDCDIHWHRSLAELPGRAAIVIANEFFDALPVRQLVRGSQGWHERCVGLDADGNLAFVQAASEAVPSGWANSAETGEVIEISPERHQMATQIGEIVAARSGLALAIDYGHARSAPGDTLQAVSRHRHVDPLAAPGECDLTAHVDFQALAAGLEAGGARTYGPMPQGEFLQRLFIEERARSLKSNTDGKGAERIEAAVRRLVAPDQMGELFKVLVAAHPSHPPPYPFGASHDA